VTLLGHRQVGSVEKSILPDASALGDELPEVVNDLDWDFEPDEQTTDVGQSSENQAKLKEKVWPCSRLSSATAMVMVIAKAIVTALVNRNHGGCDESHWVLLFPD
jgi:hypothetical protein